MCEYCKQPICPNACPSADKKRRAFGILGICYWCGSRILRGQPFQFKSNKFYCGSCAAKARLTPRYT